MYDDALSAWNYVTVTKNINPNKIILYGRSLGGTIASKLLLNLLQSNRRLPKVLFLDSTFSNLPSLAEDIFYGLDSLVTYNFNCLDNLEKVKDLLKYKNQTLPVHIFHSKSDEIVPFSQGEQLSKKLNYNLIELDGSHGHPVYDTHSIGLIKKYLK